MSMDCLPKGTAYVEWTSLLQTLGCPASGPALPCRVRCPVCAGRRLGVYDDRLVGGVWHHCPDCGTRGDGLDLAAAAWQCSRPVAVRRLKNLGLPMHIGEAK